MMSNDQLDKVIQKEEEKLAGLKKRKADIEDKIKKSESKIQQHRLMRNSNQFTAFIEAAQQKGVSAEEIMSALQAGDFLSLQERIESVNAQKEDGEASPENHSW